MSAGRTLLAGAVAVLTIAACTRAPYLSVHNRTSVPLVLQRTPPWKSDVTIAPGATQRVRFPDGMQIAVTAGPVRWRYSVQFPPRALARWSTFGRPEFQFQVEPDGRVYVLPPDAALPVHDLPPQPDGFPLTPSA